MPWQDIVGLRNILVHEYFGIYWPLVWQTAVDHAPILRAQIAAISKEPRRSREVTHLCSVRMTHLKNTACQRARSVYANIIRAEGAQGLWIQRAEQPLGQAVP